MTTRITDPTRDIAKLNDRLRQLDQALGDIQALKQQVNRTQTSSNLTTQSHEPSTINNITFTWTGSTTTLSWSQGYLQDKSGTHYSIPAGSTVVAASTAFWAAWNTTQNQMIITSNFASLWTNQNNLLICSLYTGTSGQSGAAGGGGTEAGGAGISGRNYKMF